MCVNAPVTLSSPLNNLVISRLFNLLQPISTLFNYLCLVTLEQGEKVPSRVRESVIALLLQAREEGVGLDVRIWRERALKAENKVDILLGMIKGGMDALDSSRD